MIFQAYCSTRADPDPHKVTILNVTKIGCPYAGAIRVEYVDVENLRQQRLLDLRYVISWGVTA